MGVRTAGWILQESATVAEHGWEMDALVLSGRDLLSSTRPHVPVRIRDLFAGDSMVLPRLPPLTHVALRHEAAAQGGLVFKRRRKINL
ncbi:hypothetical protein C2857_007724 [Epichloe festucae Fl1]|uniref:Uncharacterized protein n=1 Tax=Epichloe festucae (strain Fl1) TaxID=877507 RepID=A0A7S9KMP4_EPIFF|nr:hypothetical protein C2857_007724 [Epichloe festucae Fl1]